MQFYKIALSLVANLATLSGQLSKGAKTCLQLYHPIYWMSEQQQALRCNKQAV